MELRRVDPRCLKNNPRNPRKIQPGEMSDAALAASIGAIGILQPPVVSEKNGELTIAYGARRVRIAIAIGLPEIDVLVKDPDDHDHMRCGQRERRPRPRIRFCVATVLLGSHGCYGFRRYSWGISRKAHRRPGQVFPQRSEDNA